RRRGCDRRGCLRHLGGERGIMLAAPIGLAIGFIGGLRERRLHRGLHGAAHLRQRRWRHLHVRLHTRRTGTGTGTSRPARGNGANSSCPFRVARFHRPGRSCTGVEVLVRFSLFLVSGATQPFERLSDATVADSDSLSPPPSASSSAVFACATESPTPPASNAMSVTAVCVRRPR
ncbi:hypothetical protein GS640_01450, partial [Rhodococcus hoagii]|nr:hypothetical protein [Prescottella equi]